MGVSKYDGSKPSAIILCFTASGGTPIRIILKNLAKVGSSETVITAGAGAGAGTGAGIGTACGIGAGAGGATIIGGGGGGGGGKETFEVVVAGVGAGGTGIVFVVEGIEGKARVGSGGGNDGAEVAVVVLAVVVDDDVLLFKLLGKALPVCIAVVKAVGGGKTGSSIPGIRDKRDSNNINDVSIRSIS